MSKNKKINKKIKDSFRCDFIYYEGYRACLLDYMKKMMDIEKKNDSKEKDKDKK